MQRNAHFSCSKSVLGYEGSPNLSISEVTQTGFDYKGSNSARDEEFVEIREKEKLIIQCKSQDEEKERLSEGKDDLRRSKVQTMSPIG